MAADQASSQRTDYTHFTLVPLTLHIGAEISGLNLHEELSAAALQELREAFVTWKVLFFRNQHLDHSAHVAFARQFGQPTIGHVVFGHDDAHPEIYSIAKHRTANSHRDAKLTRPWSDWHTDITAAINPPMASVLRGETVPPYGGDTFWTNLAVAYTDLSPALRGFIDTLDGIHRFEMPVADGVGEAYIREVSRRQLESAHPLVTVHPETGEKLLYVSPDFLQEIEGLAPRESQQILQLLWEHVVRPEFTVRYRWQPGDVAMWDNRSTAHLAPNDIFASDFDRQMYRVTLVGESLVGVDGRPSRAISGAPIVSAEETLAAARASA